MASGKEPSEAVSQMLAASAVSSAKTEKFGFETVLLFSLRNGSYSLQSLSNLPHGVQLSMTYAPSEQSTQSAADCYLTSKDAVGFVEEYIQGGKWHFERKAQGAAIYQSDQREFGKELLAFHRHDFVERQFREINPKLKVEGSFEVSREQLVEVTKWGAEYKAIKQFGRRKPFPANLQIVSDGAELILRLPSQTDQKRNFGTHNTNRWVGNNEIGSIRTKHVQAVSELAADYDLKLEGSFLSDNRGIVAVRFEAPTHKSNFQIIIPLVATLKGDLHEITQLLK